MAPSPALATVAMVVRAVSAANMPDACARPSCETAEDIEAALKDAREFTFVYCIREVGEDWWSRGQLVIDNVDSWLQARDFFWLEVRDYEVKLAAVLQGDIAMVDQAQYGHEPSFDAGLRARYEASTKSLRHFTVFSVWHNHSADFVPTVDRVEAVDWLHAEMLCRRGRHEGIHLICGVAELYVPVLDTAIFAEFATPTGEPTPEPEPPKRRRWFRRTR